MVEAFACRLEPIAVDIVLGIVPIAGRIRLPFANLAILALALPGIVNAVNGRVAPLR